MYKKKNRMIIGMMAMVFVMVIGYAAFATNLTINGTASIESNWRVEFTKIEEISKTNGTTVTEIPTASGTTATFNVDFTTPGDEIEYQITVENKGTLDAIIDDIVIDKEEDKPIQFEISNIAKGDKLAKGASTTFNIKIKYDSSITSQPSDSDKIGILSIHINYVQDLSNNSAGGDESSKATPLDCFDYDFIPSSYTVNMDTCVAAVTAYLQSENPTMNNEEAIEEANIFCSEEAISLPELAGLLKTPFNFLVDNNIVNVTSQDKFAVINGYSCGGHVTQWNVDTPISYDENGKYMNVVIPANINGVAVKKIHSIAFNAEFGTNRDNIINKITIPEGVVSIPPSAFRLNRLTSVTIPDSVTSIGDSAFNNNKLKELRISSLNSRLNTIGNYAFVGNQLTSVTIPNSVTSIGESAFKNNELKFLTIGYGNNTSNLKTIGKEAFCDNSIGELNLPDSVTTIGSNAFQNNKLWVLNLSVNLNTIGVDAFRDNNLFQISIPSSVTTIGSGAFQNNSLSTLYIASGLNVIDANTFANNNLTSVTIPNNVTKIGNRAFYNNKIKNINIGSGIREIGPYAFGINSDGDRTLEWVTIRTSKFLVTIDSSAFAWKTGMSDSDINWQS